MDFSQKSIGVLEVEDSFPVLDQSSSSQRKEEIRLVFGEPMQRVAKLILDIHHQQPRMQPKGRIPHNFIQAFERSLLVSASPDSFEDVTPFFTFDHFRDHYVPADHASDGQAHQVNVPKLIEVFN